MSNSDPLLELVRAYQRNAAAYNASYLEDDCEVDQIAHELWFLPFSRLQSSAPSATSLDGVIEAIRLVIDEERDCGNQREFNISVLTAALAYLDGIATEGGARRIVGVPMPGAMADWNDKRGASS